MISARRFAVSVALLFAAALVGCAGFVAYVDPYWLWRQDVEWRYNPALETRMRFVKSLQVLLRQPRTVLIGSSVVYRGMNPADMIAAGTYNLGISSLRIREAEVYVQAMLRWAKPECIVLGVDYFAFDRLQPSELGFDPTLARADYLAKAGFSAFASATALKDAWRLFRRPADDPDGSWQRNGYKQTRPRTPDEIAAALTMTREIFSRTEIARSEFDALIGIIALTRRANVRLVLFVPPYHRSWLDTARKATRAGLGFEEWMQELAHVARVHGAELWDFAIANPYADGPVGSDSLHYLDPSHFSPLLGRWILARVGLAVRQSGPRPAADFGKQIDRPGPS